MKRLRFGYLVGSKLIPNESIDRDADYYWNMVYEELLEITHGKQKLDSRCDKETRCPTQDLSKFNN